MNNQNILVYNDIVVQMRLICIHSWFLVCACSMYPC